MYRLAAGARVQDAVRRAGLGRRADVTTLNLAARVTDGEQVVVPYKEGFLKIIGDLTTDHIRVFRFIFERTKNPDPNEPELTVERVLSSEIASATGLPEHRAMAYGYELVRYGVLLDWWTGRLDYQLGAFTLTEYGEEFARFLRDPSESGMSA